MTLGVLELLQLLCSSLCVRTSTRRLTALPGSVLLASNSDSIDATSCEPFWNTYECFESHFEWIFEIHVLIFWNILKADQSQLSDLGSSLWTKWLRWRLHALSLRVLSPLSFLSFFLSFLPHSFALSFLPSFQQLYWDILHILYSSHIYSVENHGI